MNINHAFLRYRAQFHHVYQDERIRHMDACLDRVCAAAREASLTVLGLTSIQGRLFRSLSGRDVEVRWTPDGFGVGHAEEFERGGAATFVRLEYDPVRGCLVHGEDWDSAKDGDTALAEAVIDWLVRGHPVAQPEP